LRSFLLQKGDGRCTKRPCVRPKQRVSERRACVFARCAPAHKIRSPGLLSAPLPCCLGNADIGRRTCLKVRLGSDPGRGARAPRIRPTAGPVLLTYVLLTYMCGGKAGPSCALLGQSRGSCPRSRIPLAATHDC